ncbi:MAG: hypothetical protein ABUJ92_00155 [Desulfobacterales bacterium]
MSNEPVRRSYTLISDDADINALGILVEIFSELTDLERKRTLDYITEWCADPENRRE